MLQILEIHDYFTLGEVLSPLIFSLAVVALNIPQKLSRSLSIKSPELLLVVLHISCVSAAFAIEIHYGNFSKTTAFYYYVEYENNIHRSNFINLLTYYVIISTVVSGVICALYQKKLIKWFFIGCFVGVPSILYVYKGRSHAKIT